MRKAFIDTLEGIAREDENVVLITPDMGFSVFERFAEKFPKRIFNVGIAEQNAVGLAAGLALCGKTVYVYSIAPFVTMRPFEQVRIDVCYQNLPVKLVGSGGGLTYGQLGPTHHSIEDMSLMRSLPNMCVLCPGDPIESELCTIESHRRPGPAYLRLGKGGREPAVHQGKPEGFAAGKSIRLREGKDATLISTGNMLPDALATCALLEGKGVDCALLSMPCVKPLDADAVLSAAEAGPVVTIEEHSIIGGLGSAVADVLAERGKGGAGKFLRMAIPDRFCKEVGSQKYLRGLCGISPEKAAGRILSFIK